MIVLTWNLFHGRDHPPDPDLFTWRSRLLRVTELSATHAQVNRPLLAEFAGWLAAEPWEVAFLQEAPPRWFAELRTATGAVGAIALTARNCGLRVRGALADWNPDLIASGEGGSNQLLARPPWRIAAVRRLTLSRLPERRRMLWARLEAPGRAPLCVANLHASAWSARAAAREVERAAAVAVEWAAAAPLVFGGDLNLRPAGSPHTFERLAERHGLAPPTGPHAIDHLLVRGLEPLEPPRALAPERRELPQPDGRALRLSDHAPIVARLAAR